MSCDIEPIPLCIEQSIKSGVGMLAALKCVCHLKPNVIVSTTFNVISLAIAMLSIECVQCSKNIIKDYLLKAKNKLKVPAGQLRALLSPYLNSPSNGCGQSIC